MKLKQFSFLMLIVLLIAFTCCTGKDEESAAKGSEANPIVMGFNPAENPEAVEINADGLVKVIEEKTGLKVKTYVAHDYSALVIALQNDHVDFAWLPSFAFVKAEEVANAEVLLKAVRDGQTYYYGAIVVRDDSPYQNLEDLEGKSIAWASETSTSGRIFPYAAMLKMGIDPEDFFSETFVAGKHDAVLQAVYHGKVDGGATFAADNHGEKGSWTQYLDADKQHEIRPIFFTEPIPSDTMSTSTKFHQKHPDIVEKIVNTVKELSDSEEGLALLKELYNIDAMVDASSEDYNPVRDAARLMGIDVEGPKKKAPEEKLSEPAEKKGDEKTEDNESS